jgi:predicted TIM-barrel fold metal-dependent hydrolase
VDLTLGDGVDPVLDRMHAIAGERLVGIRNSTAWHADPAVRSNSIQPPPGLLASDAFLAGARRLRSHGLVLDIWAYHTQLGEVLALARRLPGQRIVLDHVGGPLGVGPYLHERAEVMAQWRAAMACLSAMENVSVKLGGFGLKVMGHAYDDAPLPPSSDDLARDWRPYVDFVVDAFGPTRCMFESNFPVDKGMFSYPVLWNAFKKLSAQYADHERASLFSETAIQTYGLSINGTASS